MSNELVKNISRLIRENIQKETSFVLAQSTAVKKVVFEVYSNWDNNPKNLDTDAFTVEEGIIALNDLLEHEEDEMGTGLQVFNATSQILATQDILCFLQNTKHTPKRVIYV